MTMPLWQQRQHEQQLRKPLLAKKKLICLEIDQTVWSSWIARGLCEELEVERMER
jgi:hypothetical protein